MNLSAALDAIFQTQPVFRLLLFSLVVSSIVAAMVSMKWQERPRYSSAAIVLAFAVLLASPILALLSFASGVGWKTTLPNPGSAANSSIEFQAPADRPVSTALNPDGTDVGRVRLPSESASSPSEPGVVFLNWVEGVSLVWLIGSAIFLLRMVPGMFWLNRMMRQTREPGTAELSKLSRVRGEENSGVDIRVLPVDIVPFFFGLWRPWIVLPSRLLSEFGDDELAMVIAHEKAHARHRDQWIALLQHFTLAVQWWNPMVWRLHRQLTDTREVLCDQAVVHDRPVEFADSYSRLLIDVTSEFSASPAHSSALALAAASTFDKVHQRIVCLKNWTRANERRPSGGLLATAVLGLSILMLMASCNSVTGEPTEQPSDFARMVASGEISISSILADARVPEFDAGRQAPDKDFHLKSRVTEGEADSSAPAKIEFENSQAEPYIYITSKFVESVEKLDADMPASVIVDDEQFQKLVRLLSLKKGVDLLSAPSLMARNAQQATIEVGSSVALPSASDFDAATEEADATQDDYVNTGITLEIKPTIKRGKIFLVGKSTIRSPDSESSDPGISNGLLSFNTVESFFSVPIESGETLVLNCRRSLRQKGSLLIFLTANVVDKRGRPLEDPKPGDSPPAVSGDE